MMIENLRKIVETLKTQTTPKYSQKQIASKIFGNNSSAQSSLSKALKDEKQNTFAGKTRKEIVDTLLTDYKNQLTAIGFTLDKEKEKSFLFKQYFMTGQEEQIVAAATLELFYQEKEINKQYTRYELAIPKIIYPAFVLSGAIKSYGNTTLALLSDDPKYIAMTILHVEARFFAAEPFTDKYYFGEYLTCTIHGEMMSGIVILEYLKNKDTIHFDDIPKEIKTYLKNKKNTIPPPKKIETLTLTTKEEVLK